MRVRQLLGGHLGEVVEMPYAVAVRAIQSGTVEAVVIGDDSELSLPPLVAEQSLPPPSLHGIPRTRRRLSSAGKPRG